MEDNRRALFALYLVAFIDLFAVSLFLPLLSKEIRDLGGDPFLIGVISSVYGAVQLGSSPVMGWSSDKYGSKVVLFVCLLATAFAYVIQGHAVSLLLFFVARSLAGVFKHTQTISKSIITDLFPGRKSHVLGNYSAFGSMGFIIGPTIGAHLVEMEGGFRTVCLLASCGFLVNAGILVFYVSTRKLTAYHQYQDMKDKRFSPNGSMFSLGSWSDSGELKYSVAGILFLRLVYSSSSILPRANLPLTMESKFSTSVVHIGYLNSLQGLVSTLAGFAVGPVVAKVFNNDSEKMVKRAGLIKTISLFGLVVAPNFRLAGISMLVQSLADPFLRVGITSMSLEGHDDPGTILGLGQTATSLSRMIAPFAAGISQSFSDDGPAIVGTVAALTGLVWSYLIGRRKPHLHDNGHSNSNGRTSDYNEPTKTLETFDQKGGTNLHNL